MTTVAEPDACPFKVGQRVYYRPTVHGYGWSAMGHDLEPGQSYEVSTITEANGSHYVEIRDHPMSGGGLHWSEFSAE